MSLPRSPKSRANARLKDEKIYRVVDVRRTQNGRCILVSGSNDILGVPPG